MNIHFLILIAGIQNDNESNWIWLVFSSDAIGIRLQFALITLKATVRTEREQAKIFLDYGIHRPTAKYFDSCVFSYNGEDDDNNEVISNYKFNWTHPDEH